MTTPYIEEVQVLQGKRHGKIALSVGGTLVGIPDGFGFDVLATFPNALKEVDRRAREGRDTYWKERVRKELDRIDQDDHGAVENILRLKIKSELLKALDNLK